MNEKNVIEVNSATSLDENLTSQVNRL